MIVFPTIEPPDNEEDAESMIDSLNDVLEFTIDQGDMNPKIYTWIHQMVNEAKERIKKEYLNDKD